MPTSPSTRGAAPAAAPEHDPAATAARQTTTTAGAQPPRARRRDPLLAAICHDLRAPLAAVTMGANFVLQTTPEDEASGRSRRVLQAVIRSCKQMERLVRDFGDLSEIEGGSLDLELGVHDAGPMLEVAAETARANAQARSVAVTVKAPATPVLMRCDRERVLCALGHVLDNAVRFAPDGGVVTLALEQDAEQVRFLITDHGPGIPTETLAHLYDRTWHAKRADRAGAGLGLAIVRGLVQAHDGEVRVETVPGTTTVTLALPKSLS